MSKQYTYKEIAADRQLWMEYVDPSATMTEEEFEQMSIEERIKLQSDIWGKEVSDELDKELKS